MKLNYIHLFAYLPLLAYVVECIMTEEMLCEIKLMCIVSVFKTNSRLQSHED